MRLKSEDGKTWEPALEPNVKTVEAVEFKGPFPEKARFTVELPRGFPRRRRARAREQGGVPARHRHRRVSRRSSSFPGRFGILELNAEPVLPVTVRNVEPS